MIKAVIFDVDGVLIDSLEANFQFLSQLFNKFGYKFMTLEEYRSCIHMSMMETIEYVTKSENEEEIQKIWQAGRAREVPYSNDLIRTPDNLGEVIKELSQDYDLAIVTSRTTNVLDSMPKLENLKQYFKVHVGYIDTEKHKPDPEPLLLAAERLSLKPEECVYVGDTPTDAKAAKGAGMKSIAYHKDNVDYGDYKVSSFLELLEVVKSKYF